MKQHKRQTRFVCGTALALASFVSLSQAQVPSALEPFDRSFKPEIYGIGQYLHSGDIDLHPFGAGAFIGSLNVKMDDTGLGGFGVAYHLSSFISVEGEFMFGNATFHESFQEPLPGLIGPTFSVTRNAFVQSSRFNATYNILTRRLTPILTAGIGYQYLDIGLDFTSPTTTSFTWNAGAGLRWNITDNFFVKAVGGGNWLEYTHSSQITTQIEGIFAIGWTF